MPEPWLLSPNRQSQGFRADRTLFETGALAYSGRATSHSEVEPQKADGPEVGFGAAEVRVCPYVRKTLRGGLLNTRRVPPRGVIRAPPGWTATIQAP